MEILHYQQNMSVSKTLTRNNYSRKIVDSMLYQNPGLSKWLRQPYQQGFWVPKSKIEALREHLNSVVFFNHPSSKRLLRISRISHYNDGTVVWFSNENETNFEGFVFFEIYPESEVVIVFNNCEAVLNDERAVNPKSGETKNLEDIDKEIKIKSRFENKAAYVSREDLLLIDGSKQYRWEISGYQDFKYLFGNFLELSDKQYRQIEDFLNDKRP